MSKDQDNIQGLKSGVSKAGSVKAGSAKAGVTKEDKNRLYVILGLLLISLAALAPVFLNDKLPSWWISDPIKLGLDLRGGSYLGLGVQTKEAVKSQLNSISVQAKRELRSLKAGVVRVKQTGKDGVAITLLSDDQAQKTKVKDFMAKNYAELAPAAGTSSKTLNFKLKEDAGKRIEEDAVNNAIETIRNRVDATGVKEPTIQKSGKTRIIVQMPGAGNIDEIKETIGKVAKLDFMIVADPVNRSVPTVSKQVRGGGEVLLEDEILMSGDVIKNASSGFNPDNNEIVVNLSLNSVGAKLFDSVTADNVGRNLAIVLDGVVQSSPTIRDRISAGQVEISGRFTPQEAQQLALVLKSGALPAPLTFLEERTVGATLGEDSIRKGIVSMMIGVSLVILFILLYYRKAGIIAVLSLILNICFLMSLMALLQATLTLPGIAGLVLTIGMAVDANVIIYERIREELRAGATSRGAIEGGFLKANWTILDANITTFLTGLVLYWLGTGPIKGFAVTLCLGIVTSVFSALFVSYALFRTLKVENSKGELSI